MSKKTEQIYKAISVLEDLQNQISIMNQLSRSKGEESEQSHHLGEIEFEMGQAIKSLRFWIGSLYLYNGKSTSKAKQNASQENGKKGGRPPKEITAARRRRAELEETLIPDLRRERSITTDLEKESALDREIEDCEKELVLIEEKLEKWAEKKSAQK